MFYIKLEAMIIIEMVLLIVSIILGMGIIYLLEPKEINSYENDIKRIKR